MRRIGHAVRKGVDGCAVAFAMLVRRIAGIEGGEDLEIAVLRRRIVADDGDGAVVLSAREGAARCLRVLRRGLREDGDVMAAARADDLVWRARVVVARALHYGDRRALAVVAYVIDSRFLVAVTHHPVGAGRAGGIGVYGNGVDGKLRLRRDASRHRVEQDGRLIEPDPDQRGPSRLVEPARGRLWQHNGAGMAAAMLQ